MCETLKVKLARCRAALQLAQRKNSFSSALDFAEESRFDLAEELHEPGLQALGSEVACQTSARAVHSADVQVQSCVLTAAAEVQASNQVCHATAQTEVEVPALPHMKEELELPVLHEAAVQASPSCEECAVQISEAMQTCAVQTEVIVLECASQTEVIPGQECASQTETQVLSRDCEAQTEAQAEVDTVSTEMQTVAEDLEVRSMLRTSSTQTERPMERSECSVQATVASACSSVQVSAARSSVATQVERKVRDESIQVEDSTAAEVVQRLKDLEASTASEAAVRAKELEAWQEMATSKAMNRLNVTILCPRAECTVNGSKVEMDSWNSARLREDFEVQVLPRFMRIIMGEGEATSPTELVQSMMEELGSIFRERLAALLSAPNAAAAMAAARGRTETSPT